jgi:DNA-binding beta-propeller fold protein YncE
VQQIDLVHNALVFEPRGGYYYASIPGAVAVDGNRLARIDPAGTLQVSPPIGSEPFALAVAADGSAIVVGLDGSGEVIKFSLPGLVEQWRVRLPVDPFYGQLLPENIALSPVDPDLVAISMRRVSVSPRHGGVALIRAGVLQPRRTQDHTGSNLITFDRSGAALYGFDNDGAAGLRRIGLLADGLVEELVVAVNGSFIDARHLDVVAGGVLIERQVYGTPALALLGQAGGNTRGCRAAVAAAALLCLGQGSIGIDDGTVAVVDAASFVTGATPSFRQSPALQESASELVPGPAGQVALRFGAFLLFEPATSIRLMNSAALP